MLEVALQCLVTPAPYALRAVASVPSFVDDRSDPDADVEAQAEKPPLKKHVPAEQRTVPAVDAAQDPGVGELVLTGQAASGLPQTAVLQRTRRLPAELRNAGVHVASVPRRPRKHFLERAPSRAARTPSRRSACEPAGQGTNNRGRNSTEMAVSPDGRTLYVAGNDNDSSDFTGPFGLITIDLTTGKAAKPLALGTTPGVLAISPDGRTLYMRREAMPVGQVSSPVRGCGRPARAARRRSH